MNINEQNDFFESERVKQLLLEAHREGYIRMRINNFEFNDTDEPDDLCKLCDRQFIEYLYVKRACQFIDDVINDRFDLYTLTDTRFRYMYKHFIIEYKQKTLLRKITEYYKDSYNTSIYTLPNYFTIKPKLYYYLDFMTTAEAYTKLCDVINVAKTYELMCRTGAEDVFYSKLELVANEREKIKELDA